MKYKGFTLIELLIVVAIIGILAAIAIPNFLQAQVRAKVSRVQAEHNTVGTAVELYHVDNSIGPPDWVGGWPFYLSSSLTTPIDYMSGMVLYDPFPTLGWPRFTIPTRYRFKNLQIGTRDLDYSHVNPGTVIDQATLGKWVIYSNGPWRALALPPGFNDGLTAGDWLWLPYDPTNGTVSRGCIIRSQTMQDSRAIEYDLSRFP